MSTLTLRTQVDKYAHKHNFSEKIISNKQTFLVSKNLEFYETLRNRDGIIAQIVPLLIYNGEKTRFYKLLYSTVILKFLSNVK